MPDMQCSTMSSNAWLAVVQGAGRAIEEVLGTANGESSSSAQVHVVSVQSSRTNPSPKVSCPFFKMHSALAEQDPPKSSDATTTLGPRSLRVCLLPCAACRTQGEEIRPLDCWSALADAVVDAAGNASRLTVALGPQPAFAQPCAPTASAATIVVRCLAEANAT